MLQTAEKPAKRGEGGEASVKRNKPQPTKKKMTDAEIHAALRKYSAHFVVLLSFLGVEFRILVHRNCRLPRQVMC